MEIDVKAIKEKTAENNTTLEGIASFLGINRSTLYRKLKNGGKMLTVEEAYKICEYLKLSREESILLFWKGAGAPKNEYSAEICCRPRSDGVF